MIGTLSFFHMAADLRDSIRVSIQAAAGLGEGNRPGMRFPAVFFKSIIVR